MANISDYLRKILEARYGRDVRGSIHDAISAINEEAVEAVNNSAISAQSAQLSAESANKASSDVAAIKTDIYDTAIPAINQAVADSQAAQVAAETAREGAETARTDTEALEAQCKIYKDKCENATAGITGGLIPKGTTEYANLPALEDTSVGWLYYISDDFVTTSEFIEGEGFYYPPGTNAYVISVDGTKYWDCMGGEMSGYLMKDDFDSALQESEPEFTEATELTAISSKSKFKVVLGKIAKAITDLISLKSLVGSTDISGVGDGTVTGAVSTLNSNLDKISGIAEKLSFKKADVLPWGTSKTFNIELYGMYMLFVATTNNMGVYSVKNVNESITIIKPLINLDAITLTYTPTNQTLQLSSTIYCSANLYQLN